ncbi:MAG: hypothetical protein WC314_18145 [Vulcanimicrobiota bacterium]
MLFKGKSFLLGILLLATAVAVAAARENGPVVVGDLTLTPPSNWAQTTVPSDEPNTRAVFASKNPAEDQGLMMISVVPRKGRSLDSVVSATRQYITKKMDGVVEYEGETEVDGLPAYNFAYEGRSEHNEQGNRKFLRTIVARGDSFYILHGIADHGPFTKHAGAMREIVKSAKWTD